MIDNFFFRLALPGMTRPVLSSLPSLVVPSTRESWWAWVTRTATSVTRPSPREVGQGSDHLMNKIIENKVNH